MSENRSRQQAVLVLGMHRSGTSAVTRVLNLLGAELNSEMLAAASDNPKGFWESARAVELHERLFAAMSRTWYDMHELPQDWVSHPVVRTAVKEIVELVRQDFDGTQLWGIKDPRMCLVVPLWLEALASLDIDVKALFVARNPVEVSASLRVRNTRERNQWGLGYAPVMWAQYLAAAEAATRDIPRAMLTYDELMADWQAVMTRVATDLDMAWPRAFEEVGAEIDAFLDRGERHHDESFDAGEARRIGVPDLVVRMYEECLSITRCGTAWQGLASLGGEYFAAAAFFSGALDNVFGQYQSLELRAAESEGARLHAEAVVDIRSGELEEYRQQAREYDALLSAANAQNETLTAMQAALVESATTQAAAFERDLAAYQVQARAYDDLLCEANGKIESLSQQLQERAANFGRDLAAYEAQAQAYDESLRVANGQIDSLNRQLQALPASFEEDLAAYQAQARTYDDLLREANGRIDRQEHQIHEQGAAYEQELVAYRDQAEIFKETLARYQQQATVFESERIAYQEQAAGFERELEAYRRQAATYDDLLREANGRIDALTRQLQG
jgi:hypothetical protein